MSEAIKYLLQKELTSEKSKKTVYSSYPFGMPMPNRALSGVCDEYNYETVTVGKPPVDPIANHNFDNGSLMGWKSVNISTFVNSSGKLEAQASIAPVSSTLYYELPTVIGQEYEISLDYNKLSGSYFEEFMITNLHYASTVIAAKNLVSGVRNTIRFKARSALSVIVISRYLGTSAVDYTIDDVNIKMVTLCTGPNGGECAYSGDYTNAATSIIPPYGNTTWSWVTYGGSTLSNAGGVFSATSTSPTSGNYTEIENGVYAENQQKYIITVDVDDMAATNPMRLMIKTNSMIYFSQPLKKGINVFYWTSNITSRLNLALSANNTSQTSFVKLKSLYIEKAIDQQVATTCKKYKPLFSVNNYRFGFNGQEKDDEVYGAGNLNTAEFWEYDTRIGRRWNVDPIPRIWESPYATFSNNPIYFSDVNGDQPGGDPGDPNGAKLQQNDDCSPEPVRMKNSNIKEVKVMGCRKPTTPTSVPAKEGFWSKVTRIIKIGFNDVKDFLNTGVKNWGAKIHNGKNLGEFMDFGTAKKIGEDIDLPVVPDGGGGTPDKIIGFTFEWINAGTDAMDKAQGAQEGWPNSNFKQFLTKDYYSKLGTQIKKTTSEDVNHKSQEAANQTMNKPKNDTILRRFDKNGNQVGGYTKLNGSLKTDTVDVYEK